MSLIGPCFAEAEFGLFITLSKINMNRSRARKPNCSLSTKPKAWPAGLGD